MGCLNISVGQPIFTYDGIMELPLFTNDFELVTFHIDSFTKPLEKNNNFKKIIIQNYVAHFALIESNRVSRWTNTFYICRGVSIVRKIARLYTLVVVISMIYK